MMCWNSHKKTAHSPYFMDIALSLCGTHFWKTEGEASPRMLKDFASVFFQTGEHPDLTVNCPPEGVTFSGTQVCLPMSHQR